MVIGLSGGMTHLVQNMHQNKPNLFLYIKTFFCYLVFCICKWNPLPPPGIFADMYHFKASPKGIWKMHVCTWLVGGGGCAATFFTHSKLFKVVFNLICKLKFSTLLLSSKNYYCACHKVKRNICKIVDNSAFTTVKTFVNKPFADLIPFINLADVC